MGMPLNRRCVVPSGKVVTMAVGLVAALSGAPVANGLPAQGACKINPASLAYSPGYAQLVVALDRRTVYVAGQVAQDSTGALLGGADPAAQTRAVFGNLRRALDVVGAGWADVLHWNIYVTAAELVPVFRQVRQEVLAGVAPPAATLVQVQGLARSDWLLEVEAVVAAPRLLDCATLRRRERPTVP